MGAFLSNQQQAYIFSENSVMCLVLIYSLILNIYIIFNNLIVYGLAGNCAKEERVQ